MFANGMWGKEKGSIRAKLKRDNKKDKGGSAKGSSNGKR